MPTDIGDPLLARSREERDQILADRRARAPIAPVEGGALFVSPARLHSSQLSALRRLGLPPRRASAN